MKTRFKPFYSLLSFILLFVFFLLADTLIEALIVVLTISALLKLFGVKAEKAVKPLFRLYMFFLTVFFFNAFFQNGETVYFSWWIFTLTKEGILTGLDVILRVFAVSILANILTLSMSAVELTDALSILFSPLRILHIPVDQASFIIAEAFRFIPGLQKDAENVKKSMRARGAHGNMNLARMVLPLSISAFRRADDMSSALISRGYDGNTRRRTVLMRPGRNDLLLLLSSILFVVKGVL